MIVESLIILIFVLAICKKRLSAFIFAIITLGQDMFLSGLEGPMYYDTMIRLDFLIIVLIACFCKETKLAKKLQIISGVSIILNCIGWEMWGYYVDPLSYNTAYILLYSWTVIVIIKDEDRSYDG